MATKTNKRKSTNKSNVSDQLFDDFFNVTWNSMLALEVQFSIDGVRDQIFGTDEEGELAKGNLRRSHAWNTLQALYNYAVNGVEPGPEHDGESSLVINGSDVLKLVASEEYWTSEAWDNIIAMGDGRFGLDSGDPIDHYKVALLANVDLRTVRNAISAGELATFRPGDGKYIFVENASARRWLHGRRGFKPTLLKDGNEALRIENVNTPAEFTLFLTNQRKHIGLDADGEKLVVLHPNATPHAIAQLEAGIFTLPLDAVFPVADFYQLNRKEFLQCVMRTFFYEELRLLSDATDSRGD